MYRRKKKREQKWKLILLVVILFCCVGLLFFIIRDDRKLNPIEKTLKDTSLFFEKLLLKPVEWIRGSHSKQTESKDTTGLKQQIDQLQLKNKELETTIEQLKAVTNLNQTLTETEYINATTIGRDVGYWYDTITIDKGTNDGVEVGMPVMVNEGLIGRVMKTSWNHSTIELITSEKSNIHKISVKIESEGRYVYGLFNGYDKKTNHYRIEGISENVVIPEGALVTTTGMGEKFPSGILLGRVKNVTTDQFDLARFLEVESDVNFHQLSFVTVLKRKGNAS